MSDIGEISTDHNAADFVAQEQPADSVPSSEKPDTEASSVQEPTAEQLDSTPSEDNEVGSEPSQEVQTEATDIQISPEVIQEIRKHEAHGIVHAHITRAGNIDPKLKNLSEAQEAAFSYRQFSNELMNLPSGRLNPPKVIEGGNPLYVQRIGNNYIATESGQSVTSITAKVIKEDGPYFSCVVNGRDVDISVSEILNSQILSEQEHIRTIFPENSAELKVMDTHLAYLKDRKSGITVDEGTLHEAGRNTGLIDAKGLEATIRRNTEEGSELQQELIGYINGQVIANPQTAGMVLSRLNMTDTKISEIDSGIKHKQEEIQDLQSQLNSITDDNEGTRALKQQLQMMIGQLQGEIGNETGGLIKQLNDLKHLQSELPQTDIAMITQVAKMYDGTLDLDLSKKVNHALHTGDIDKLLIEMIGGLPLPPEQKAKYENLRKIAAVAGGGALAIVLMMLMKGLSEQE